MTLSSYFEHLAGYHCSIFLTITAILSVQTNRQLSKGPWFLEWATRNQTLACCYCYLGYQHNRWRHETSCKTKKREGSRIGNFRKGNCSPTIFQKSSSKPIQLAYVKILLNLESTKLNQNLNENLWNEMQAIGSLMLLTFSLSQSKPGR